MSKLRVLIISDTHRNIRKLDEVMEREKKLDLVIHLGDLEGHGDYIKEVAKCPLEAVRGNMDFDWEWPFETMVEVGNHLIFMTHGHRYNVDYDLYELEDMARGCGADIAMFGHTHRPYFERKEDGFVLLNPGSLSNPRQDPRKGSYVVMEVDEETGETQYHQEFLK